MSENILENEFLTITRYTGVEGAPMYQFTFTGAKHVSDWTFIQMTREQFVQALDLIVRFYASNEDLREDVKKALNKDYEGVDHPRT